MKTVVLKVGGRLLDEATWPAVVTEVADLRDRGHAVVIVHGGGPEITEMSARLGLKARFVHGRRVTDSSTLAVVEMVLSGVINRRLVGGLQRQGIPALGLSGRDLDLVVARRRPELGEVGEPVQVRREVLQALLQNGWVVVLAPICSDGHGQALNVNADEVAAAVAGALEAECLFLLTDTPGVLDASGRRLPWLTPRAFDRLVQAGIIRDGMIPKAAAAVEALARGVQQVLITSLGPAPLVHQLKESEWGTWIGRDEEDARPVLGFRGQGEAPDS
ncbi:MAG: acetylglutamate kinase [Acidobacteria bacterium]|nr:acetylglutamate kinase [Acidobacteriota bacterium]MDW7983079.1 acetylglutamate kinase [Acidobacteriota bacterium]